MTDIAHGTGPVQDTRGAGERPGDQDRRTSRADRGIQAKGPALPRPGGRWIFPQRIAVRWESVTSPLP